MHLAVSKRDYSKISFYVEDSMNSEFSKGTAVTVIKDGVDITHKVMGLVIREEGDSNGKD